jgi:hypothetical protein
MLRPASFFNTPSIALDMVVVVVASLPEEGFSDETSSVEKRVSPTI